MSDVSGYLVGRDPGQWPSGTSQAEDVVFAAVRKDGSRLEGMEFRHCTFANVSFKDATLEKCRFTDCVFLVCYFRRTKLSETAFIGCKFVGCDFPRVTIQSCDFKYSRFEGCALPFGELELSLPREPNLREELTRGLAIASDILGLGNEARHYRLAAIQAREEHLRSAVFGRNDWYQLHYPGLQRLEGLLQWVASRANGIIWGHGEKWVVLVFNILLLALVIFPGLSGFPNAILGPFGVFRE